MSVEHLTITKPETNCGSEQLRKINKNHWVCRLVVELVLTGWTGLETTGRDTIQLDLNHKALMLLQIDILSVSKQTNKKKRC